MLLLLPVKEKTITLWCGSGEGFLKNGLAWGVLIFKKGVCVPPGGSLFRNSHIHHKYIIDYDAFQDQEGSYV